MQSVFKAAMLKMSVLGQNTKEMVDCSDVIPVPKALPVSAAPHLPPGLVEADIQQSVSAQLRP